MVPEDARLDEEAGAETVEPDPRVTADEERAAEEARAAVEAVREAAAGAERVTVLAAVEAVREAADMRPSDELAAEPPAAVVPAAPAVRTTRPTPARGLAEMVELRPPRVASSRP